VVELEPAKENLILIKEKELLLLKLSQLKKKLKNKFRKLLKNFKEKDLNLKLRNIVERKETLTNKEFLMSNVFKMKKTKSLKLQSS
jgi:hypothetical protein